MSLLKRQGYIGNNSQCDYLKLDKEDHEETIHRKAQFLVYKAMEEADRIHSRRIRPSFLRMRLFKVKVKIGNRLKSLRRRTLLVISVIRAGACRHMARQLKACRTMFGARQANARLPNLLI